MAMFILLWLYLFFTFQVCPFFWSIVDKSALDEPYYLYVSFLFCLFINFLLSLWKEKFNNSNDLLYRFFRFLFKPFNYVFTFFFCEFKKIFNFLLLFKYKKFLYLFFNIFLYFFKIPGLIWKPIFKKWSYFGYFKSNKSKWTNKR